MTQTRRSNKGQSMVEAALAIPFMLLCMYGIAYFGKVTQTDQILLTAAQETARVAAVTPNLKDNRFQVCGFDDGGQEYNSKAVAYSILGAANLLSNGKTGNLPSGASVRIYLPGEETGVAGDVVQPGTISVRVEYPFSLLKNPFTRQSTAQVEPAEIQLKYSLDPQEPAYRFADFKLSEKVTTAQQVYQNP
jgi:hypothetical protein